MIIDNISEIVNKSYPVVIIGSGPAGITIAEKLEQKIINCLIVEAGDNEYNEKLEILVGDARLGRGPRPFRFTDAPSTNPNNRANIYN